MDKNDFYGTMTFGRNAGAFLNCAAGKLRCKSRRFQGGIRHGNQADRRRFQSDDAGATASAQRLGGRAVFGGTGRPYHRRNGLQRLSRHDSLSAARHPAWNGVGEKGSGICTFRRRGFFPPARRRFRPFWMIQKGGFARFFSYAYNAFHQQEANCAALVNALGRQCSSYWWDGRRAGA